MVSSRLLGGAGASIVVAVAASFLGWGRSGRAVRSSYGLFDAADRAGLLPDTVASLGLVVFCIPAIAGAALVAHATGHTRAAAAMYVVTGAMLAIAAGLVVASPLVVEPMALLSGVSGAAGAALAVVFVLKAGWAPNRQHHRSR